MPTPTSSTTKPHTRNTSPSAPKTDISINIYDLLPPGRLANLLWTVGSALLHSGVVINDREYAYGGHNRRNVTGVYYTKPRFEPPGGTFRSTVVQGVTHATPEELEGIIKDVSHEFLGTSYNLLTNNCNHFTTVLCERLTGKGAPGWLNRAASIGLALPCMVPKEWIGPPDCETAEGELVDEEEEDDDERVGMLESERRKQRRRDRRSGQHEDVGNSVAGGRRIMNTNKMLPARLVDASGRELPAAERAPLPKR